MELVWILSKWTQLENLYESCWNESSVSLNRKKNFPMNHSTTHNKCFEPAKPNQFVAIAGILKTYEQNGISCRFRFDKLTLKTKHISFIDLLESLTSTEQWISQKMRVPPSTKEQRPQWKSRGIAWLVPASCVPRINSKSFPVVIFFFSVLWIATWVPRIEWVKSATTYMCVRCSWMWPRSKAENNW